MPGKCILAGEHSVVRGRQALVTPLRSRALTLHTLKSEGSGFTIEEGPYAAPLSLALQRASELAPFPKGHWKFSVHSDIPTRAGLGSSAALSVAVANFFAPNDVFALALELENIFHGSSSGLDLAAVMSEGPILFRKGTKSEPVTLSWRPFLYLADTGLRSSTRACVEKVAALHRADLDDRMQEATLKIRKSFVDGESTFSQIASALEDAAEIFREWELVPEAVEKKMKELKNLGAHAVKPTGSGDGGFVLGLWSEPPQGAASLSSELIPIWDS